MKYVIILLLIVVGFFYMLYKSSTDHASVIHTAISSHDAKGGLSSSAVSDHAVSDFPSEPVVTCRHIFYSRQSDDVLAVLKPLFAKEAAHQDSQPVNLSLTDPRSREAPKDEGYEFSNDPLTNTIYARLPKKRSVEFEEYCRSMDKQPEQLAIHLVMANATLEKGESFGINWLTRHAPPSVQASGLLGLVAQLAGTLTTTFQISSAANFFQALLTLSDTNKSFKIVSTPSATTVSGKEATFTSGTQIPFTTQSTQNTVSQTGEITSLLEFKDVVLQVKILPIVTTNGILLHIDQRNDAVTDTVVINGNPVPVISTQTLVTNCILQPDQAVLLLNNDTAQKTRNATGLPGLDKIPFLNTLFSTSVKDLQRTQLVLIIWPEIIKPSRKPVYPRDLDPEDVAPIVTLPSLRVSGK